MKTMKTALIAGVMCLLALSGLARAQNVPAESELEEAVKQAQAAQRLGPATIALAEQAILDLPQGRIFIPAPAAARLMQALGNRTDERLLGLVIPDDSAGWMAVIEFEKAGYIKDDEAKDWNAAALLQGLKDGTEASNASRRGRGMAELEVIGWIEKPAYDPSTHRLVWSAEARGKGDKADTGSSVNYNTYALGREGFISLNLVTSREHIEAEKPVARALLANLQFVEGKRYGDFDAATDKVAEYGLAALIGGVAAKKLGLFAVAAALVAKFYKLILVAVLGFGAIAVKLWRGRKERQATV